jgi:CRISPR-associated protein Cas1
VCNENLRRLLGGEGFLVPNSYCIRLLTPHILELRTQFPTRIVHSYLRGRSILRNRIVEIAESPARLRVERQQLVVELPEGQVHSVPLEDLAVIIVAHPQVSYTQAVLSELVSRGGTFVTCDRSRMPIGILLPLDAHTTQTQKFREQIEFPVPRAKRIWQQIVREKIRMQGRLLERVHGSDSGLFSLIPQVRSGDPENVEARAARKYWTALFGSDFRRDRDAADHNRMLNYGYAVLRAATARAICAAGLHPSLGVHHHNKYNSWCLADDVMEPYRPVVDRAVTQLVSGCDDIPEFDQQTRAALLASLTTFVRIDGQNRTLFDALALTAQSLAAAIQQSSVGLKLPEDFADAPE